MPTTFVNGKKIMLPSAISPDTVIQNTGRQNIDPSKRIVVLTSTSGNRRLKPNETYHPHEGDKFKVVPDRIKGSDEFTYFSGKESWRKQLITEQVAQVSQHFFKKSTVELDDECNWVVFDGFKLPDSWIQANSGKAFVRMMIIFPDQYPDLPTNGFYLPASLTIPANATHFYSRGYGGAFGETGEEMEAMAQGNWKWYCTHIKPGAWQPASLKYVSDWKKGDNLWDIITICIDVLTYPLDD